MEKAKAISLYELNSQIKTEVKKMFPGAFWVVAEISEINANQSGHCYLELIEKAAESDQIVARAKATIWAYTYRMLKPYFESVTGERLMPGIKVMLQGDVEFHESYGFSLNIKDIEPNFTLGDLSRKKQQIIQQLQDEGVFHLNKELELTDIPKKIAVISSETAAGYGDFVNQLQHNNYGYRYEITLFNAIMQGDTAEKSIVSALDTIFSTPEHFDLVVIIRGGGSQADLNCFNSYWLAYHITQFPIPVITGIGHDRDQTIADMVAHTALKTPTAVAEFIIEKSAEFESYLEQLYTQFADLVNEKLNSLQNQLQMLGTEFSHQIRHLVQNKQMQLQRLEITMGQRVTQNLKSVSHVVQLQKNRVKSVTHNLVTQRRKEFDSTQKTLEYKLKHLHKTQKHLLDEYTNRAQLLDPKHLLKRGYTLTFNNGMLIKSAQQLKPGDIITSKWFDSTTESTVQEIKTENSNK